MYESTHVRMLQPMMAYPNMSAQVTGLVKQLGAVSDGSSDGPDRNSNSRGVDRRPWSLRRRLSADQQRAMIQGSRDGIRQKDLAQ